MEVVYLDHIVRAVSLPKGWRVQVIERNLEPVRVYTSSALYSSAEEAVLSGKEFVRQQIALISLWEFLCECHHSGHITSAELDALSASLCFFCCFRDAHSPHNYWHR